MTEPVKMLLMFVNETDSWHGTPLYEAIVHRLRQLTVAGATVQSGIMGFGHHIRPGHKVCLAFQTIAPHHRRR